MDQTTEQPNNDTPQEGSTAVVVEEKAEVTAPSTVTIEEKKEEPREIAYTISDPMFPDFLVVKSDNAWWMDVRRVNKLIDAFKSGLSVKAALLYTGISKDQYYYFLKQHPSFSELMDVLEQAQEVGFMNLINTEGQKDLHTARWYLDRTHPRFSTKVKVDGDGVLKPTTVNNNVAIIAGSVESTKITEGIDRIIESIIGRRKDEILHDGGSGSQVEDSSKEGGA